MLFRIRNYVLFGLFTTLLSQSLTAADPNIPLYRVGNRATGWTLGEKHDGKPLRSQYLDEVQPILTTRCIACHGCYEAPCQLNLQSYDGLRRGFNPIPIFSAKRVDYTAPTRMDDASTIEGWRALGFLPVASHADEKSAADKPVHYQDSLIYRFRPGVFDKQQ